MLPEKCIECGSVAHWDEGAESYKCINCGLLMSYDDAISMRTIAVDFDGVIHHYKKTDGIAWRNATGDLIKDADVIIKKLKEMGYIVVVFTSRKDLDPVKEFLKRHFMDFLRITNEKVKAAVYLDDRGLKFNGDWQKVFGEILTFKTYLGY